MSKKQEKPVYIRYANEEAVDSKKDLLFCESSFLKILRSMKNYQNLRKEEYKIKSSLKSTIKKINSNIDQIQKNAPDFRTPRRLKKYENPEEQDDSYKKKDISSMSKKKEYNKNINKQLEDINKRLGDLK